MKKIHTFICGVSYEFFTHQLNEEFDNIYKILKKFDTIQYKKNHKKMRRKAKRPTIHARCS